MSPSVAIPHCVSRSLPDAQLACGIGPVGEFKSKPGVEKPAWYDPATFENQFRLCPHQKRADFNHPPSCGQSESHTAGSSQMPHELCVRQGVRRRQIHSTVELLAIDQPVDGVDEILLVNPRDILTSVADRSTEACQCQTAQNVEDASTVRAHRHRRPEENLTRARGRSHPGRPAPTP